jgi:hypothetical protein
LIPFGDNVFSFLILSAFIIPLGVMVNYGDLQFPERIMVTRRSEMSAGWKVRFAICIASVAIQAFTNFFDVLKATNCTFQEVDNIFRLAVGIAEYDEFFSCICAAEFLCALDVFARHISSRITCLTLTIVVRSRGDVGSYQYIFQTFGFPESQEGRFFEDFAQFWVFLYGCRVLTNDVG